MSAEIYSKATPRPWRAKIWEHPGKTDTVCIYGPSGEEIISWAGFDGVRCTKAEIKANAKLVQRAVNSVEALEARVDELEEALGQVAGKNDLSGVDDADVEAAARTALYECELIARAALTSGDR